ncbi:hypothetical protein CWB96_22085 [Pseudoalteromonas citrea]|uniref:Uncharacterized protein n=1 Tax=Pseudoalteromonas citrea TaxID=43655 RepID=A0A5S3XFA6_9GAMM|nr:hypothetical protein [Pseudoalteromonas citrea]TMP40984.1 hypothetical protein CWB97_16075 [Pseudoalteromonas citrea]TMP51896.1 hypothetical protein CWB96_22085 [Pseudoalteromonas citrea]
MGNAIIRKWSEQTYPGFDALKSYIESCDVISYKNDEVNRSDSDSCIWFRDASSGRSQADMEYVLNTPKFRHFHNLMPAGTDPVVAFCQLMVLQYRTRLNLANESGTYLINFHVWHDVFANKNEAQLSQQVNFNYSSSNKGNFSAIVCL